MSLEHINARLPPGIKMKWHVNLVWKTLIWLVICVGWFDLDPGKHIRLITARTGGGKEEEMNTLAEKDGFTFAHGNVWMNISFFY